MRGDVTRCVSPSPISAVTKSLPRVRTDDRRICDYPRDFYPTSLTRLVSYAAPNACPVCVGTKKSHTIGKSITNLRFIFYAYVVKPDAILKTAAMDLPRLPRPSRPPPLPTLPDDVWGKILFKSGTPMMLVFLRVNAQFRRVAKRLLRETRTLHVTRHFEQIDRDNIGDGLRNNPAPTYYNTPVSSINSAMREHDVVMLLMSFPKLHTITVTRWRYHDTRADIADIVCGPGVLSVTVRHVELRHVAISAVAIRHLVMSCPRLAELCIGSHDSVDNAVVRALVAALVPNLQPNNQYNRHVRYNHNNNSAVGATAPDAHVQGNEHVHDNGVRSERQTKRHGAGAELERGSEQRQRRLESLSIVDSRKIGDDGIDAVLSSRIARRVTLKELPNLRVAHVLAFGTDAVIVSRCNNLGTIRVRCGMADGDEEVRWDDDDDDDNDDNEGDSVDGWEGNSTSAMKRSHAYVNADSCVTGPELNFSQNRNLRTVTFEITPSATSSSPKSKTNARTLPKPPPLVCTANSLNLSGCAQLRNVYMRRAREDAGNNNRNTDDDDMFVENDDGTVQCALPFLKEINLFGTRQLYQHTFTHALGLSSSASAQRLPVLRQLVVNGSSVERLDLQGLPHLKNVDASGSAIRELCVGQCPKLETVVLNGWRMPLTSVTLMLPPRCTLTGRRPEWTYERQVTHQMIAFP